MQKALGKIGKEAIQKEINPQDLRGYFVSKSMREGKSIKWILKLLGLKNLDSLETYLLKTPTNLIKLK
jgi:site-specific recombinase XerD